MTSNLAQLPDEVVTNLKTLKTQDRTKFLSAVHELRTLGWPLRAIATPLDVSRSAVRNWEKAAPTPEPGTPTLEAPAPPTTAYGSGTRAVRIPRDLNAKDAATIRELSDLAKKKTRWSTPTSPEAIASEDLSQMLITATRRKIPLATLARHMGVTRRAVAQRIEKLEV